MYLFRTNLFSLIGQNWVQNNYIPCCFSNIRGDEAVDREVWASITGLLWVEPLACRVRAFQARQDGLRLYGDSQFIKHINICYLVASQPPSKANKWTDLSLLVKEKTESSERLENYPKSHSYWVESWAHTQVLGLLTHCHFWLLSGRPGVHNEALSQFLLSTQHAQ